jgi:glycerate kinase
MPSTIVVCPDSFKGSADASEVARAIANGWRRERPGDRMRLLPMADGGEGTLDALLAANPDGEPRPVEATGPDGQPVTGRWLRLRDDSGHDVGVVELAITTGLTLPRPADGTDADSTGFGEAIAAALDAGVHSVLLALGGSATSDGGAGALRALGARMHDAQGRDIRPGNRGLADLATVDLSGLRPLPPGGARILADVRSPLLGPEGAIAVFGAQKGIGPEQAADAEHRLARFARLVREQRGTDPATPGSGAAGGAGFAMLAWGASVVSGAATVAAELGLPGALERADAVITGEGRYDRQSDQGKVVSVVSDLARRHGVPALLVAGAIDGDRSRFAGAASLTETAGSLEAALAEPERWIAEAAAALARRLDVEQAAQVARPGPAPRNGQDHTI